VPGFGALLCVEAAAFLPSTKSPDWSTHEPGRRHVMRFMFWLYIALIAAGVTVYSIIGLTHT